MKKGFLARAIALGLGMSMVLSSSAFASLGKDTGGTGDTENEPYIIQLSAITNEGLKTSLNAFERNDAGSQITTAQWVVGSYSDVDVEVTLRVGIVDPKADIDIFTDRSKVNGATTTLDEKIVKKQAYVELVPASSVAVDTSKNTALLENVFIFDKEATTESNRPVWPALGNAATNVPVPVADPLTEPDQAAQMIFRLKKGEFATKEDPASKYTGAADAKSVSVVRLKGNLNPVIEYGDSDFKVRASYKAKGIPELMYTNFTPLTNTHAVLSIKAGQPAGPSITSSTGTVAAGAVIEYDLGGLGKDAIDTTFFTIDYEASPNMMTWATNAPQFLVDDQQIIITAGAAGALGAGSHEFSFKIGGTTLTGQLVLN